MVNLCNSASMPKVPYTPYISDGYTLRGCMEKGRYRPLTISLIFSAASS